MILAAFSFVAGMIVGAVLGIFTLICWVGVVWSRNFP